MAYERTWTFSFNNGYRAETALDQTRWQLWATKAILCGQLGGLVSGIWSVYSSCDSLTAGNADGPGTDRWGSTYTASKIVLGTAGNVHSWVVLKSPTMANGLVCYLTISFDGTSSQGSTTFSKTAPSAGSTTANPTAADSWTMAATTGTYNPAVVGTYTRTHLCLSSTGDFYLFQNQAGVGFPYVGLAVVSPVGVHASDVYPWWTFRAYSTNQPGPFAAANLYSVSVSATKLSAGTAGFVTCTMSPFTGVVTSAADLLTGKLMTLPAYINATATAGGTWHARGRLPDTFVVPGGGSATAALSGPVIIDGSGNVTHLQVGGIIIPANSMPNFA
jgi:hypothetical protein